MEFLFVIWEGGTDAESADHDDVMAAMGTYVFGLLEKGKLKGGAPLYEPGQGATVRTRRGKVTAVDGPYLETKEVISGSHCLTRSPSASVLECTTELLGGTSASCESASARRQHRDSAASYRRSSRWKTSSALFSY